MNDEQCQGCGIFTGGKEEPWELTDYRGHRICSWCLARWRHRDELAGREISFEEFKEGKLK